MAIEIKEVSNTIDLKQFIQFPMRMYKENPYYVPPLISEEIAALSHDKNELYREGKAKSKYFWHTKMAKSWGVLQQ